MSSLTIWCNQAFSPAAETRLLASLGPHRLLPAPQRSASVLDVAPPDPAFPTADIAFGQPPPEVCLASPRLRWVALTSAGYTRYDTPEFLETFRDRGHRLTNASSVFAEPCAQHVLAMMLALSRQLLPAHDEQHTGRAWKYHELRARSVLLTGQTVLLLGYGTIARRLAELLAPFHVKLIAVRRRAHSESGIHIISEERLTSALGEADHVINLLPENDHTHHYVNARRLAALKPGARFYNIGRGPTVDETALLRALDSGHLASAYLDVFATEPLPPHHPLWSAPNCHLTPHTAGGRHDQDDALVSHFLTNLAAFTSGHPLTDVVV